MSNNSVSCDRIDTNTPINPVDDIALLALRSYIHIGMHQCRAATTITLLGIRYSLGVVSCVTTVSVIAFR